MKSYDCADEKWWKLSFSRVHNASKYATENYQIIEYGNIFTSTLFSCTNVLEKIGKFIILKKF